MHRIEAESKQDLHEGTAEEADADHEHPAGDGANAVDEVAKGQSQVVLGDPAVDGVESSLVGRDLLEFLLGVDLVELLWRDSGGVHVDDVQGGGEALLVDGLGLGNLVVVDGGSTG